MYRVRIAEHTYTYRATVVISERIGLRKRVKEVLSIRGEVITAFADEAERLARNDATVRALAVAIGTRLSATIRSITLE